MLRPWIIVRWVISRGAGAEALSRLSKAMPRALLGRVGASAPGGREVASSTRVFQAAQAAHWPDHFDATAPQLWQMKTAPFKGV